MRARHDTGLGTMTLYAEHLDATANWLVASFEKGNGGSCAHWTIPFGWSRPYPETTGYIIPTLLALESRLDGFANPGLARRAGDWLLSIQNADGSWNGGLHSAEKPGKSSVFNTAQILKGLVALARVRGESRWLDAAAHGARWLAAGVGHDGCWSRNDYRASTTPSYYTHVAWPMLETWSETHDDFVRDSAVRVLRAMIARRAKNGVIHGWGFAPGQPAFTHTIAYTIRGCLESARLLDDWDEFGEPVVPALDVLLKKSEYSGGALAGAFDDDWMSAGDFTCLTGNAQTAINFLLWERRANDLRIVNAAAKLVDGVCDAQQLSHPLRGVRGGVAGSRPVWGSYMRLRYPNWAAKYHCDALLSLTDRIERELGLLARPHHLRSLLPSINGRTEAAAGVAARAS